MHTCAVCFLVCARAKRVYRSMLSKPIVKPVGSHPCSPPVLHYGSSLPRKKLEGGRGEKGGGSKEAQSSRSIQMMLAPRLIEVVVYKRNLPSTSYWPSPSVSTAHKSVRFCLGTKHMVFTADNLAEYILITWIMGKAPGRLFRSMWESGQWEAIILGPLEVTFPS